MSDISFVLTAGTAPSELPDELAPLAQVRDGRVHIAAMKPARPLYLLTRWALENDEDLGDLTVGRPTLEDVYLRLTDSREQPR